MPFSLLLPGQVLRPAPLPERRPAPHARQRQGRPRQRPAHDDRRVRHVRRRGGFPQVKATLSATTYLLPADQGLTAGATPAGPAGATTATRHLHRPRLRSRDAVPDATSGADLVEKRLWPIALVLVAVLVAVPLTLGSGGSAGLRARGRRRRRRATPGPRPAPARPSCPSRPRRRRSGAGPARCAIPSCSPRRCKGHRRPGALRRHAGLRQRSAPTHRGRELHAVAAPSGTTGDDAVRRPRPTRRSSSVSLRFGQATGSSGTSTTWPG